MSDYKSRKENLRAEILNHLSTFPADIEPNFSKLARQTGVQRHTAARVYRQIVSGDKPKKRIRKSKFDPYDEEIKALLDSPMVNMKAVFRYLQKLYGTEVFNSYDSFKSHVKARNLRPGSENKDNED